MTGLVVCSRCQAVNRTRADRGGDKPKCGKCHQPLFDGPVELTAATFDGHVSRGNIPVLLDFWAPWCGPCKMMAPQYVQAAAALEPAVRVAKVDTESEPGLGARYNIRSIPTLVLFKDGKEVARQAGAMGAADIVQWVRSHTG